MTRKIAMALRSRPTIEGAGVHLKRVFGFQQAPDLDPFLLLDDFSSDDPEKYLAGFPWHPHRGIETITYVLEGHVEHGDSMGNRGVITEGDVQWMTAGSGIIHQEMPKGRDDGLLRGFQLWANLPARDKMMEPRYRDIKAGSIPVVNLDSGGTVRVICGRFEGVEGPARDIVIEPEYLDVSLPSGAVFARKVPLGHTVFAYVTEGAAHFDRDHDPFAYDVQGENYFDLERDCLIRSGTLVKYADGDGIEISASPDGARFLLVSGRPLGEPVAWQGPIVMNTREELRIAFEEYRDGTFLKHA